ncbi:MAG: hypothetical protein JXQ99_07725 [Hyphomicrobiaceae bacterium]
MSFQLSRWIGALSLSAVAIALATYSVQLNYRYAIWLFGSLGISAPVLYAFGIAVADIGKLALPWTIGEQWTQRRRLAAAGTTTLMIGLAAASIWALVSLGLQGRESVADAARVHTAQISDLKTQRVALAAQLANYGTIAAPEVISRSMKAMEFDRRWASTVGCTKVTASASRAFCAEHGRLFSQLAGATKAEELRTKIATMNSRIETARRSGGTATPYAAQVILAGLIGTRNESVGAVTLLAIAVLIEILALVMAAAAIEQLRQLLLPAATVPEMPKNSRLNDADDYSDFTDLDGPLDCSDDMPIEPSLKPCPPVSNVTPLRSDISGVEGPFTRSTTDTINDAPTVPRQDRCAPSISGTVGSLALAVDPDLEDGIDQAPATVPAERLVIVPADPCPVAFWDACVIRARNKRVASSELYAAYQVWCRERAVEPVSQTAVTRRIKAARKVRHHKSDGRKVFAGVELR